MTMTKTAALREARKLISDLYRVGHQWGFSLGIPGTRNWSESRPTDYERARSQRADAIVGLALKFMGRDQDFYDSMAGSHEGTVERRLGAALWREDWNAQRAAAKLAEGCKHV
jgi:hypothetical protein